jgi:hypothetical protein
MGNEAKGAVRDGKNRYQGKILLETSELIFRCPDYRLKIAFSEIRCVEVVEGELCVETGAGAKIFEVGEAAEKWREKILHPKSRLEKLGVKAGTPVRIVGEDQVGFQKELKASKADILAAQDSTAAEATFLFANTSSALAKVTTFAKKLKCAEALWIVYPKGRKEITENLAISAGRTAGLKDVKVVGFSATHTALKFVLPRAKR